MSKTALSILSLLALGLAGCGLTLPNDPHGTLERVRDGELRVGLVLGAGGVRADRERVQGFAEQIGAASVRFEESDAHALVTKLERGDLDMIASFPRKTPFTGAGFTRPFIGADDEQRVWGVRAGENAFLLEANRYLYERDTP